MSREDWTIEEVWRVTDKNGVIKYLRTEDEKNALLERIAIEKTARTENYISPEDRTTLGDALHQVFMSSRHASGPGIPSLIDGVIRAGWRPPVKEEDRSAGRWCEICQWHGGHHTDQHNWEE